MRVEHHGGQVFLLVPLNGRAKRIPLSPEEVQSLVTGLIAARREVYGSDWSASVYWSP